MPQAKKANRGEKLSFPREERELKGWICDHRQQGYVVTCGTIRMKVKQLINNELFRASVGWYTHFMHCNKLVLQQKIKICQRLPIDLKDKNILTPMKKAPKCMMRHEQTQQMVSKDSGDDQFLGF